MSIRRRSSLTQVSAHDIKFEKLEDRRLLALNLFVDFGDNFPGGTLTTTQGDFRDVADDAVPGDKILGTTLLDASDNFNAGTQLDIVAQVFSATARARMMAVVQRAYLPLDVNVIELTAAAQLTPDGRNVAAATSMADVINTLRGGNAAWKDAYVFVAEFIVDPGGGDEQIYTGGGGKSPSSPTLGVQSDLAAASNTHDDVAAVYSDGGFSFNTLNNISHEAGHLLGLRHGITNRAISAVTNLFHQAEIMSYRNTNNTTSSMFTRYPSIRGDNNSPGFTIDATINAAARTITRAAGDFTTEGLVAGQQIRLAGADANNGVYTIQSIAATVLTLTPAAALVDDAQSIGISWGPLNYNDIAPRNGQVTNHDQLRMDGGVLANASFTFVTGTGAHDIITISKNGGIADVTVQAFADPAYTTSITVPGEADGTYSYSIPLTRTILVYAGDSNDRIIVDGDLGVDIVIDGMLGTDTLIVDGKNALMANYTPDGFALPGVDIAGGNPVTDFGGTLTIGGDSITFNNFETTGSVLVQNVMEVNYLTPLIGVDDLLLDEGTFAQVTGTVNGGTGAVPLLLQNVDRLDVLTGSSNDTLTVDLGLVSPFAGGVRYFGGLDVDTLDDDSGTANLFVIDGGNSGNLDGFLEFQAVENLLGSTSADEFRFLAAGNLDGLIDGESGPDHFNYAIQSSQSLALTASLVNGFAGVVIGGNIVGGGFEGINQISGSLLGSTDAINGLDDLATWLINNGNDTYTVNAMSLALMNFETFNGGSDLDAFYVRATNTTVNLNGFGDDDTFILSSDAPGMTGNVSGIQGTTNVDGGSGNNRLRVVDASGTGNNNVVITSNAITGIAPALITYTASGSFTNPGMFNGVWIVGAAGESENFTVLSFLATNTLRIDANGGNDSITTDFGALGDMKLDGGAGSDDVEVQFIDGLRRINAHDSGIGDLDTLTLLGLVTPDSLVVRHTSVARNVSDRVWHDSNTEQLNVYARGGNDTLNIAASDADQVLMKGGDGDDFAQFINTGNASLMEFRGGRHSDRIRVNMTEANTTTIVKGQHDRDFVFVGSTKNMDNGSLDRIRGPLMLNGGNNDDPGDRLYMNDRVTVPGQIYRINDMRVESLSPRIFNGLDHERFEVVLLDGTDQADEFEVTPSARNRFVIGGNLPLKHDINCAAEGDFLNLVAGPETGRHLNLVDPDAGDGVWTFTNGFEGVFFTSIERFNHVDRLAVGSDAFLHSEVRVLDAESRDVLFTINPYEPTFTGGVRVATGDVSGDGIPDIITAPGAGRPPEVRIYDGLNGQFIDSFMAYEPHMWDGLLVATGDIRGDCGVDIVTTPGPGPARAEVRIFENQGNDFDLVDSFLPFGDHFTGGADVAVADINGDSTGDIVVGALHGHAQVAVFDGSVPNGGNVLSRFLAFGDDFFGGVHVEVGNILGGDTAELIVSTGYNAWDPQYDSQVHIYDGDSLPFAPHTFVAPDFAFQAFDQHSQASTRVEAKDFDMDGLVDELFASHGADGVVGEILVFEPLNPNVIDSIFENDFAFENGIFVG